MQTTFELVRPDASNLREDDTTIHWVLVAMVEFGNNLDKEGLYLDDLDEASQQLQERLDSTIHIRVYNYTGFDTANFEDIQPDPDPNHFNSTLVNDIIQSVMIGKLDIYEGNFLLSNMDKLDLERTRAKIDELINPYFNNADNFKR